MLETGQYAIILDDKDGTKRAIYGPTVEWMGGRESLATQSNCPHLLVSEYITVEDGANGTARNICGPKLFKPGPYDAMSTKMPVYQLSKNQYLRIKDKEGKMRVEAGEARIIPDPSDSVENGIEEAINIDDHHAVLVRNEDTGDLVLHTEHGIFFPGPYQKIVEVKEKIILEEYQTVVYKDPSGKFLYCRGDSEMRDFFLPPFCEIIFQEWSTDLRKEHLEAEKVWKFDRRPSYMNYEFNCRTIDNVELAVNVSFFWAIIDVPLLIRKTADAPGDTCTHARSSIIQEVSKIPLLEFLEEFNKIIRKACIGDTFYEERGVNLISVEVLKFHCASAETDSILQDIIKETADRLKKKERQRGENEVAISRLGGEIEEEKMKKELIELKKSHLKIEARIEGEAEANKLTAFLEKTTNKESVLTLQESISMYMTMRKLDSVHALAEGASQIYLTPQDVNLSVGSLFPTQGAPPTSKMI